MLLSVHPSFFVRWRGAGVVDCMLGASSQLEALGSKLICFDPLSFD